MFGWSLTWCVVRMDWRRIASHGQTLLRGAQAPWCGFVQRADVSVA